jgi:thermitase
VFQRLTFRGVYASLVTLFISTLIITSIGVAQEFVPGEFVVLLKSHTSTSAFLNRYTVESYSAAGLPIRLVRIPEIQASNYSAIVNRLYLNPEVELVEPNYVYELFDRTMGAEPPVKGFSITEPPLPEKSAEIGANDPDLRKSWGLENVGQPDGWGRAGRAGVDNGVVRAWSLQQGSKDVVVAVIDSGLNYNHPDIQDNVWTNALEAAGQPGVDDDKNGFVDDIHGYDFVNADGDPLDDHGHGTHVASIIGAKGNNQMGMAGINWNVSLMPLKFATKEGRGSLELGIRAIQYATQMKARVINNSWGGRNYSEILSRVVEEANKQNILFVAAAGNSGWDNLDTPIFPASLKNDNVLSVAAFDQQGQLWNGSCYGETTVHLGAPGFDVWGLWNDKYRTATGTSMASPHVAGVAALVLAQEPHLTVAELKERLLRTAKSVPHLRGKTITGATVDAYYALTNQQAPLNTDDPEFWLSKQELKVSSEHPYPDKVRQEWEFKFEGAKEVSLFFENFDFEHRKDFVELYDKKGGRIYVLTGKTGKGWTPIVRGDLVKVVLISDDFRNNYGFDITRAAFR